MTNGSFERFTERARKVLTLAQEEAERLNHDYLGTEHLLLGLVREKEGVAAKTLSNLGLDLSRLRTAVEVSIGRGGHAVSGEIRFMPVAKKVIDLAAQESRELGHHYIGTEHLLLGLLRQGEGTAVSVLESMGVNIEKVRTEVTKLLLSARRGQSVLPLPWPRGLDQFGVELVGEAALGRLDPVVGRLEHVERLIQVLGRRSRPNPVLIGEPGVGKTAIIRGLAHRIAQGQVPLGLLRARLVAVDLDTSIAASRNQSGKSDVDYDAGLGEAMIDAGLLSVSQLRKALERQMRMSRRGLHVLLETILEDMGLIDFRNPDPQVLARLQEGRRMNAGAEVSESVEAGMGRTIFVVEDIDLFFGPMGDPTSLQLQELLRLALTVGAAQMIGTARVRAYRETIEGDRTLGRLLQPVMIDESTREETVAVLQCLRPRFEEHHRVRITEGAINAVVSSAKPGIMGGCMPERAVSLLDETAAHVAARTDVIPADIQELRRRLAEVGSEKDAAIHGHRYQDAERLRNVESELRQSEEKLLKERRASRAVEATEVTEADVLEVVSKLPGRLGRSAT